MINDGKLAPEVREQEYDHEMSEQAVSEYEKSGNANIRRGSDTV